MSGMIDSVSKVFLVQHRDRSMHFAGFDSERALVEDVARYADFRDDDRGPRGHIEWLESLKKVIDAYILATKQDYELDGHKSPDRSGESGG